MDGGKSCRPCRPQEPSYRDSAGYNDEDGYTGTKCKPFPKCPANHAAKGASATAPGKCEQCPAGKWAGCQEDVYYQHRDGLGKSPFSPRALLSRTLRARPGQPGVHSADGRIRVGCCFQATSAATSQKGRARKANTGVAPDPYGPATITTGRMAKRRRDTTACPATAMMGTRTPTCTGRPSANVSRIAARTRSSRAGAPPRRGSAPRAAPGNTETPTAVAPTVSSARRPSATPGSASWPRGCGRGGWSAPRARPAGSRTKAATRRGPASRSRRACTAGTAPASGPPKSVWAGASGVGAARPRRTRAGPSSPATSNSPAPGARASTTTEPSPGVRRRLSKPSILFAQAPIFRANQTSRASSATTRRLLSTTTAGEKTTG